MATWPVTIPQAFSPDGFIFQPGKNVLRTSMTSGPPKSRKIADSAPWVVKGNMEMTAAEFATWETFYTVTIDDGAEPFDWVHPVAGTTKEFQYSSEPVITPLGGNNWNLYMELEMFI